MTVMDKARDLAEAISQSPEILAFREAEARLAGDDAARSLWESYRELKIQRRQDDKLSQLEDEVANNPLVSDFLDKQQSLVNLVQGVNFLLRQGVGEDADSGCHHCPHLN